MGRLLHHGTDPLQPSRTSHEPAKGRWENISLAKSKEEENRRSIFFPPDQTSLEVSA